jgi:hypothetical protein
LLTGNREERPDIDRIYMNFVSDLHHHQRTSADLNDAGSSHYGFRVRVPTRDSYGMELILTEAGR